MDNNESNDDYVHTLDFEIESIEPIGLIDSSIRLFETEFDDIQEVEFGILQLFVTFIVGTNPPINVIEGFIRRISRNLNVDKVVMVKKGMFIVHFLTMDSRDKFLSGHYFFDSKPLILKPWTAEMDMEKEDMKSH